MQLRDLEIGVRVQRQRCLRRGVQADPAIVSRQRPGPGPQHLPGGHQLIEHSRLVVRNPGREDEGLPGARRNRYPGQLVDHRGHPIDPVQFLAHELPVGKEPAEGGIVHRLDLGAQCGQRASTDLAQHLGVAPFTRRGDPGRRIAGGGPEFAFDHPRFGAQTLQDRQDDGAAQPQGGGGLGDGEGPVGAPVTSDEVAQRVGHRFNKRQRDPHWQWDPQPVA